MQNKISISEIGSLEQKENPSSDCEKESEEYILVTVQSENFRQQQLRQNSRQSVGIYR